jgi:hypothetical protein
MPDLMTSPQSVEGLVERLTDAAAHFSTNAASAKNPTPLGMVDALLTEAAMP